MESNFITGVKKSADERFASGLFCAESVVLALAEHMGIQSEVLPKMATAFCSGMGRTCGTCGALTGAVMGVSLAFGRSSPDAPALPSYAATQKLIGMFESEFGSRDCHVLLGCDLGTPEGQATFRENKLGKRCANYTSRAAEMAANIISEERMKDVQKDEVRSAVRQTYSQVAQAQSSSCCAPSCCSAAPADNTIASISAVALGYSQEDAASVPDGADMGLGCGNPQAIAALKPGEVVLDLGSGGGFDSFLAARQVGDSGRVIGVDMTPEMLSKARANAARGGYTNVEFRLGEIENLPVADNTADVVISNCVINLSPDKRRVFAEAFRALKPGGRIAVSDVVATAAMPEEIKKDMALHACCVAGAALIGDLEDAMRAAGFEQIRITPKEESRAFICEWAPGSKAEEYVVSASIEAVKPR